MGVLDSDIANVGEVSVIRLARRHDGIVVGESDIFFTCFSIVAPLRVPHDELMLTDLEHGCEHEEALIEVFTSVGTEYYMWFLVQEVFCQGHLPILSCMMFKVLSSILIELLHLFLAELAYAALAVGDYFVCLHD